MTIPDVLIPALEMWREQNATAAANALMFPSQAKKRAAADDDETDVAGRSGEDVTGTPIRPENWLRRRLKPKIRALGIEGPVNFQVLRHTFATNAPDHGTNPKDLAAHLRHSNIGTTLNCYTQSIPANVRKLVNAVAEDVMAGEKLLTERVQ